MCIVTQTDVTVNAVNGLNGTLDSCTYFLGSQGNPGDVTMEDEDALIERVTLLKSEGLVESAEDAAISDTEEEIFAKPANSGDSLSFKQLNKYRLSLVTFAMFGLSFFVYLSTVAVLPSQVLSLVGRENKGKLLSAVLGTGGVITFIVSPLIGTMSDRLQTRFGKRSPIMIISSIITCVVLFGLALTAPTLPGCQKNSCFFINESKPVCSHHKSSCQTDKENLTLYGVFFVVYMIVSGSYAAVSVAWNGLIADMCPDDLRGFASGMAGLFTLLGYGAGALWNVFYRVLFIASSVSGIVLEWCI